MSEVVMAQNDEKKDSDNDLINKHDSYIYFISNVYFKQSSSRE